jgi:hypothetical protein
LVCVFFVKKLVIQVQFILLSPDKRGNPFISGHLSNCPPPEAMKRRSLLKSFVAALAALPLALRASVTSTACRRRELIQTSPVRGHRYYDGPDVISQLRPGDRLTLIAEPENPHDEFAVRVEWRGAKLGYLPRERNHQVSRMLRGVTREGQRVTPIAVDAAVREIEHEIKPYQPVTIDVLACFANTTRV